MTVLSYLYGKIMDLAINSPVNGNNIVDGINATENIYLKEKMEFIGKLEINHTSRIRMITSASKYVSIEFSKQCIHILNNRDRLHCLKVSTNM